VPGRFTAATARGLGWAGIALGSVWLSGMMQAAAAAEYSAEAVKAAYVLRFTSYITWPQSEARSFSIAVLDDAETAARLRALVADRSVSNRPIEVRPVRSLDEARGAQVLFVGTMRRTGRDELRRFAAAARGTLVITDSERGLEAGSAINLLVVDRRVRFEVSLDAARRAGLHVSSGLLSVAARVIGGRQRGVPP
jgi:hypothetical protein